LSAINLAVGYVFLSAFYLVFDFVDLSAHEIQDIHTGVGLLIQEEFNHVLLRMDFSAFSTLIRVCLILDAVLNQLILTKSKAN